MEFKSPACMNPSAPSPPCSACIDPFSRSSTLIDFDGASQAYTSMSSPQAWLVSSKRRSMPSLLDPPPGSPLDLLQPINSPLDNSQWNKRLSLLTHRYLREYGLGKEDEIMEKAWRTLELFCIEESARKSLEKFQSTFYPTRPWRDLQTQSLSLNRTPSWLSFASFLDDSFNLSHSDLSLDSPSSVMGTLTDNSANANNARTLMHHTTARGTFQSPLGYSDQHPGLENMAGRVNPRYMTPTASSRAQVCTPEPRAQTPSVRSGTGKRKAWMAFAAKRVGIVPGTPQSKKEGRVYKRMSPQSSPQDKKGEELLYQHANKDLRFSPNVPAPTVQEAKSTNTVSNHETLLPLTPSPAKDVRQRGLAQRPSPPDKPLPSLPMATVQTRSPIVRRSLIDAKEKPLRRSVSPSPGTKLGDMWPILSPSRPTTPRIDPAKVPDDSQKDEELIENKSGFITESAVYDKNCVGQIGLNVAAPNYESGRHGAQGDSVRTEVANANTEGNSRLAAETIAEEPKDERTTSEVDPPNAKLSQSTGVNEETSSVHAHTRPSPGNERASEANPSATDHKLSLPTPQDDPFSQDHTKPKASKLPKRLSAPAPDHNTNSTARIESGRSSSYTPPSAITLRGPFVQRNHPSSIPRKLVDRSRIQHANDTLPHAPITSEAATTLIAVKQSSKQGRSSIPRPHHHHQPPQRVDSESESEIPILKLSREKLESTRTAIDKPDDADLDTDENRKGKAVEATQTSDLPKSDKKATKTWGKSGITIEVDDEDVSEKQESLVSSSLLEPSISNNSSSTTIKAQDSTVSAPNSSSTVEPYVDTSCQRQLIHKPSDRVKRLSATAPEYGPILRISDSAERIIMGNGSEDDVDSEDRSAPELQSLAVKDHGESATGLLDSFASLSQDLTTHSLNKNEYRQEAGETSSLGRLSRSRTEVHTPTKESFSLICGKSVVDSDEGGGTAKPINQPDWPLKSPLQASTELQLVEEDSPDEGKPWVSPVKIPHIPPIRLKRSSFSTISHQENLTKASESSGSASKKPQFQAGQVSARDGARSIVEKKLASTFPNQISPAAQSNSHFPPRTSSRANTPETWARYHAELNQIRARRIPNRFESVRAKTNPGDTSLSKSTTVDPETLRNSVHKTKDIGDLSTSTSAPRENSKPHLSSAKGVLSNLKGLFQKRSLDAPTASSAAKSKVADSSAIVSINGSPYSKYHSRTLPKNFTPNKGEYKGASVIATPSDAFPPITPPKGPYSSALDKDDFRRATDLAMRLLDAARTQADPAKRSHLMRLGELMVEAVTGARDAEKAMEEGKQAAARAEIHCMRSKKSVLELTKLVGRELDGVLGSYCN